MKLQRSLPAILTALGLTAIALAFSVPLLLGPAVLAPEVSVSAASEMPIYQAVDVQTNLFTDSEQGRTALSVGPGGSAVVVWQSRRQEGGTYGVYARAFAPSGRPSTGERRLNDYLPGAQRSPSVAVAGDGTVWAAWESWGQDGSGAGVVARRFDGDLTPRGEEIAVNVERRGDQSEAVIEVNRRGNALVAWSTEVSTDAELPGGDVRARLFAPDGRPLGGEIPLSAAADSGRSHLPAVIASGDRFLVVWARAGAGGGIEGRFIEADGAAQPKTIRFSPPRVGAPSIEPALAVTGRGRIAVAWLRPQSTGYAVEVRRFTTAGEPLAPSLTVTDEDAAWHSGVALAATDDGRLMVSYNSESARGDRSDIVTRFLTADGELAGGLAGTGRIAPGDGTGGGRSTHQRRLTVASGTRRTAWRADGSLLVAWNGNGGTGDPKAAHLSIWRPSTATAPPPPPPIATATLPARRVVSEEFLAANPPIWNPDYTPQGRLARSRAAGGDFGFEAIPGTVWGPPDPEMAVGPDQIVVMTNGAIAAFDLGGHLAWQDEIENSFGFWGELGADNFVFDPEVQWDPHASRFLAMASERSDASRSYFLLAVSKDDHPDDRDDWHKYRLDVTDLAGNDIDSPNLAVGRDSVLLTADFFGPDKYLIYILDKSSILDGGAPVATGELITGAGQQSMGVPVVYSDTGTLYILQSTEFSSNDTVIVHAITDPFTNYLRQTFTLPVPTYTFPAAPPQLGTSARPTLFEPRFWSVAERGGSLWAVHHVDSSRARARWYEIDLGGWPAGGTPTLAQEGEIDLGTGISTFFPSIDVDALGNAAITFSRSAANEYISIGRAVRRVGDATGTLRPVQVVQTSANPQTTGRWGDYSATQADPVQSDTFWGHHEFTDGASSSWRSWVARYDLRPEAMQLTVDPLVAGSPATLAVSGATPGATVYFLFSTGGTGLTELAPLQTVVSLEGPAPLRTVVADGSGAASFTVTVPAGGAGRTLWLQAAETAHASNWLQRTVQVQ